MSINKDDIYFMKRAIACARSASRIGEVPIGAVLVKNGEIIARGFNTRETKSNALHHAEIIAINRACKRLNVWRLSECTLYVTTEPCPMCAGAIINARIKRVVFGCRDPKAGACGSVIDLVNYPFNHKYEVTEGVLEAECSALLSEFFKELRSRPKGEKLK